MILMKLRLRNGLRSPGRIRPALRRALLVPSDECVRGYVCGDWTEAQRIHHCDWPRAHGEDIAQNAADAGGRALERFDERRVIVRFDFEGAGPTVADVNDAGILARSLQHEFAARGQA